MNSPSEIMQSIVALISGGSLGVFLTLWFSRNKTKAETHSINTNSLIQTAELFKESMNDFKKELEHVRKNYKILEIKFTDFVHHLKDVLGNEYETVDQIKDDVEKVINSHT